ncbi:hypothetical protein CR513_43030, partial [Mucuna pruriens]
MTRPEISFLSALSVGSPRKGIVYTDREQIDIIRYSYADRAEDAVTRLSKKLSREDEYRAMAHTTCELLWLKSLLQELQFCKGPMELMYNNQSALAKPIKVDCHFLGEKILLGIIKASSIFFKA